MPKAITGWLVESDNTLSATMVSDDKWNGKYYNDSFHYPGTTSDWSIELDKAQSNSLSRDVFGLSDVNLWRVGTGGLIQGRELNKKGQLSWSNLTNVTNEQSSLELVAVWANSEVVVIAGNRKLEDNQSALVLLVHALNQDMGKSANWSEYTLKTYKGSKLCKNADCLASAASINDLWGHKNTLVAVGHYYEMKGQWSVNNLKQSPLIIRRDP